MFKKIIILTILIPNICFAQIGEQILKQIEKVNSGTPGLPKLAEPCRECSTKNSNSVLFETCIKKICDEKGLMSYTQIPKISADDLAKPAEGEKELELLFDRLGAVTSEVDSVVEKEKIYSLLKSGQFASNEENLDLAFQFAVTNIGGQVIKWNMTTNKAEFDEEKFNSINIPLSNKNKLVMKERVKNFISSLPKITEFRSFDGEDSFSYLSNQYPGLSRVDAINRLISDFKSDFESFKQSGFGRLINKIADNDFLFPKELISEIESGNDISEMSIKDLIAKKTNFSNMRNYFSFGQSTGSVKIDYADLRSRMSNPQFIAKTIENDKKEKMSKELSKNNGKISCLSAYRLNSLRLPSTAQLAALKTAISEVKKDIGEKWALKYSTHTRTKIAEYLGKVNFLIPPSKDNYRIGFANRIQREIKEKTRNADIKVKDYETLAFFSVFLSFSKEFSKNGEEKETASYSDLCEMDKTSPLNDANYTLLGKIQVSYTSVHALEMGKGVVAHELGHGVSQIFMAKQASDGSSKKHQGFLGCLNSKHTMNGSQYVEEDYADWVAANITSVNKACLYPHSFTPSIKQIENEHKGDPHSSDFFRLIHIESIQRGLLPDECNALLVEQGTATDFLSCQKLLDTNEGSIN